MYCIYCIINNINHKTYIGQHKTDNLNDDYMGSGILLKQAYNKYGIENFTKSILAVTETKENVNILEKYFIESYHNEGKAEYNMAAGGDGGFVLRNASEEKLNDWKIKIGKKSKGHIVSEEARQRISKAHTGMKFSEEHRRRIGEASRHRRHSEETRRKMSLSQRGKKKKPMSEIGKENIRLAHLGQKPWNKGKSSGYHWYTDGVNDVLTKECPEGFHAGKIGRKWTNEQKLKISMTMKKISEEKRKKK